jgi:hypothetical protein
MAQIDIRHPLTGASASMTVWKDGQLNLLFTHILMSSRHLAANGFYAIKPIEVSIWVADMGAWAAKYGNCWKFASLSLGNNIFIHQNLIKPQQIGHILHEYCHLLFGNNEQDVHKAAIEICEKVIQHYDDIILSFQNKTVAYYVSKSDYEDALGYLKATISLFSPTQA